MRFDLLIKGGEVVDPGGGRSGRLDVAVKRNRIAAVDPDIPAESAFRVIDAAGRHVTPGLVDLHTHVNYGLGFYGIRPDPIAARSGVTTWLDVRLLGRLQLPRLPRVHHREGPRPHLRAPQHLIDRPHRAHLGARQSRLH